MRFGEVCREILTASFGVDFRGASPTTVLPKLDGSDEWHALRAKLKRYFGIELPDEDLGQLRTVRDLLECVRLRLREQQVAAAQTPRSPC
jgi:hypothetical protein